MAFGTEWFIEHGRRPAAARGLAVRVTRLYLVRHGRAAAGWNTDPDPGLDAVGREQAAAVAARLAPLGPLGHGVAARCGAAGDGGRRWPRRGASPPRSSRGVAEIPSPEGVAMADRVEWLRAAMAGHVDGLGPRYTAFRDGVAAALRSR